MKAGLIEKLSSARWHVPRVRPFPSNVSSKKIRSPRAMSAACGSGGGRALTWQAARRSASATATSRPPVRMTGGSAPRPSEEVRKLTPRAHVTRRPHHSSSADEFGEGLLRAADPGVSVGQEEMIEVQGEQAAIRAPQAALHRLRVVAEEGIRDEHERSVGVPHDSVRHRQGALDPWDAEGGLVGAEHPDLMTLDPPGQDLARGESAHAKLADLALLAEVIEPGLVAPHLAVERAHEAGGLPRVEAIGEEHVARRSAPLEPLEPLLGHEGIEEHPGGLDVVAAHLDPDRRVNGRPVEDAGEDLADAHPSRIPRPPSLAIIRGPVMVRWRPPRGVARVTVAAPSPWLADLPPPAPAPAPHGAPPPPLP